MRNLFYLFIAIPCLMYSQNYSDYDLRIQYDINGNIDIGSTQELLQDAGLSYIGDGVYAYVVYRKGCSENNGWGALSEARTQIALAGNNIVRSSNEFKSLRKGNFTKVYSSNACYMKAVEYKRAHNRDGSIMYRKSDVIYNMKQLKDHLDYGIITQAQYNQKIQKWRNLYNRMF